MISKHDIQKPTQYKLNAPPFLDPRKFNSIWGKTFHCILGQDGVEIEGEKFRYDGGYPAPGTAVVVKLGYWATYQIKDELDAYNAKIEEIEGQEKEMERQRSIDRRLKAEAHHKELGAILPFKYVAGIKDVLSGLSPNSWGDGRNRATVQHIMLIEDYNGPRIKRDAYDLLCTTASGTNGKNWTDQRKETWVDDDGVEYMAPITCKSCLKRAEAFKTSKK